MADLTISQLAIVRFIEICIIADIYTFSCRYLCDVWAITIQQVAAKCLAMLVIPMVLYAAINPISLHLRVSVIDTTTWR